MDEPKSMERLGVGIIGTGFISNLHAQAYLANDKARITAVCDIDIERAKKKAADWGAARYYTDHNELLRDNEVDLVEILTPHFLHKKIAIDAARAGKHISVQKPMAFSPAECSEMISEAERARVKLKAFEHYVFYPPYVKAKQLIDEGAIGEPLSFRFRFTGGRWRPDNIPSHYVPTPWRNDPSQRGFGSFMDGGCHQIALARYLLGEIDQVHAWIENLGTSNESPAVVSWSYAQKSGSTRRYGIFERFNAKELEVHSQFFPTDERLEISGTRGYIWVTLNHGRLFQTAPVILYRDGQLTHFDNIRSDFKDGFIDSADHFLRCILDDTEPVLSGEDGKRVLEIILAIYESAKSGQQTKTITGPLPIVNHGERQVVNQESN